MRPSLAILGLVVAAGTAHAEDARGLATSASFTPGMLRATDGGKGFVNVTTDFDGAASSIRLNANGEVSLGWRVRAAVRLLDAFSDKPRPGIGAGIRWLDGELKSSAYLFYKTEGFSEPEGEIEALVSFERSLGAVAAVANVAYGQDPEGNERDAELAFTAHSELRDGWFVGGTARYRDALGTTKEAVARDGFVGPTSTFAFGSVALSLNAGLAMTQLQQMKSRAYGPAASLSLGAAF